MDELSDPAQLIQAQQVKQDEKAGQDPERDQKAERDQPGQDQLISGLHSLDLIEAMASSNFQQIQMPDQGLFIYDIVTIITCAEA